MRKFERKLAEWSSERLADFLSYRYALLTEAPGNICKPASNDVLPYSPFYDSHYPYRSLVGSIDAEPWTTLCAVPPTSLLHPNPFEPSTVRGSGSYRCWDSAIAVPACSLRKDRITSLNNVPTLRGINTHWTDTVTPALSYIGPLGPRGNVLRPHGAYILDLTAMGPFGWTLREAAHILAHLRGDLDTADPWKLERNKVGHYNVDALTELVVGIIYDLPVDVTNKQDAEPGAPNTYYGTLVQATTYMQNPVLRIPWTGSNAPRVDSTLAAMLCGVYIEPVPSGFLDSTGQYTHADIWAGGPSMVLIVGWESIDYVMHMPLGKFNSNPKSPSNYVIRGVDLLPPDTYWGYLALAARRMGVPQTGYRWRYVQDWINSDEYLELRATTPGLPCPQCYMVNSKTPEAPKRPKGKHPKGPRKQWPHRWRVYYDELDACIALGKKAVEAYEPKYYSTVDYPRLRAKDRTAAHNRRLQALKRQAVEQARLESAIAKTQGKKSGELTDREQKSLVAYKQELKRARASSRA